MKSAVMARDQSVPCYCYIPTKNLLRISAPVTIAYSTAQIIDERLGTLIIVPILVKYCANTAGAKREYYIQGKYTSVIPSST